MAQTKVSYGAVKAIAAQRASAYRVWVSMKVSSLFCRSKQREQKHHRGEVSRRKVPEALGCFRPQSA